MSESMRLLVVAAGICGSDVQRLRRGFNPASLGHELVAMDPGRGTPVAVRPLRPCHNCQHCRAGHSEHCPYDRSIGRWDDGAGGFSGFVVAEQEQLYCLPAQVPVAVATLADPLACVLHAIEAVPLTGVRGLVIGDGPMASIAATCLRLAGAGHVTISVKSEDRLERLDAFADQVVTGHEVEPCAFEVVVEAVGGTTTAPLSLAARAVAPLGVIIALGVYEPDVEIGIRVRELLEKECVLRGAKSYRVGGQRDDFRAALVLLGAELSHFAPIVTTVASWPEPEEIASLIETRAGLKTVLVDQNQFTRA